MGGGAEVADTAGATVEVESIPRGPSPVDSAIGSAGDSACADPRPATDPASRVVAVYYACGDAVPGQLHAAYRAVPDTADPVRAALAQMLRGPTAQERALGYRSLFSEATAGMLNGVSRSAGGDTLRIDFADFRAALGDAVRPTSFLAGGVMADITWTVFRQFPDIQALRFAFDGDEGAFWEWLAGEGSEAQVFTREDWERV